MLHLHPYAAFAWPILPLVLVDCTLAPTLQPLDLILRHNLEP